MRLSVKPDRWRHQRPLSLHQSRNTPSSASMRREPDKLKGFFPPQIVPPYRICVNKEQGTCGNRSDSRLLEEAFVAEGFSQIPLFSCKTSKTFKPSRSPRGLLFNWTQRGWWARSQTARQRKRWGAATQRALWICSCSTYWSFTHALQTSPRKETPAEHLRRTPVKREEPLSESEHVLQWSSLSVQDGNDAVLFVRRCLL